MKSRREQSAAVPPSDGAQSGATAMRIAAQGRGGNAERAGNPSPRDIRDRRQWRREERYRALVAASSRIIWAANSDGPIEEELASWCAFTGQSADDARGWGWLSAIHADDRVGATSAWEHAVTTGDSYEVEYRLRRFDGVYRTVAVRGVAIREDDGTIREWAGFIDDITEHKELEDIVRKSERTFRATFEQAPVGIAHVALDGQLLLVNTRFCEIAGLRRDELLTRKFQDLDDPNEVELDLAEVNRVLTGELESYSIEKRHQRPDGSEVWIAVVISLLRDARGAPDYYVAVMEDITERRQLQRSTHGALNALLAMAESLVQTADETDDDAASPRAATVTAREVARRLAELTCSVLRCRRVALSSVEPGTDITRPLAIVGLSPEQEREWIGRADTESHLNDVPDPRLVQRLLAGEVVIVDVTQPPYNGRPNHYGVREVLVAPMRIGETLVGTLTLDHGGTPHCYTPAELALAGAVGKLAALVVERERLLHERAAARANILALREANRRMDEFLSIASHELRTPLTTIKANVQLADRRVKRLTDGTRAGDVGTTLAPVHDLLERAERQTELLNRLVGDLLDVTRMQAGKLELRPEDADLAEIVRNGVESQRHVAPKRSIALHLPDGAVPVNADADRIGQVVTNYLTNALKYSPEHSPVVVRLETNGTLARVSVRDEGPGLPPEEQVRIWERFHRAPGISVQSGTGVGLGLGLHISKTIVERHGGAVGVESAPGQGSTFWFTLPLRG